jgi:hypothetical protein
MSDKNQSTGEFMVRTHFNTTKDSIVDQIKVKSAELINLIESIPEKEDWSAREKSSLNRLKARSYTLLEDACSIGVKAATVGL